MATTTIKTTYSLDVETVRALEAMAKHWKVSKSEALRLAIRTASAQTEPTPNTPLRALDRLQERLDLSEADRRRWERESLAERRAASEHRGR
jgi:Ribbon-helix-helix protein, copG family